MTVTAPKLQAKGIGNTSYETFLAGVDTTGDGVNDDIYIINNQSDLFAKFKSPWSVGLGAGIKLGKSRLHISGEWFSPIPEYTVLASDPFIGQSSGDIIQIIVLDERVQVFNYGAGFEWYVNEDLSLFGSFAFDHSAAPDNTPSLNAFGTFANSSVFGSNFLHLGFGTDFSTKFADLTIGAIYSGASQDFDRSISLEEGTGQDSQRGSITRTRWRFLLGFSFPFLNDAKKKLEGEE